MSTSITLAAHWWLGRRIAMGMLLLAILAAPAFASSSPSPPASLSVATPAASILGAQRDGPWEKHYAIGQLSGDIETSIGRWSTDRPPTGSAWLTQGGPAPILFVQLRYALRIR